MIIVWHFTRKRKHATRRGRRRKKTASRRSHRSRGARHPKKRWSYKITRLEPNRAAYDFERAFMKNYMAFHPLDNEPSKSKSKDEWVLPQTNRASQWFAHMGPSHHIPPL